MSSSVTSLFQPLHVGAVNVQHRVVMAPLTRFRANKGHIHGELAKTYYDQRASVPGTLIISEGTLIAPQAGGYANVPGIWSDAQIAGWKAVSSFVFSFSSRYTDSQKGHRCGAHKGIVYLSPTMSTGPRCGLHGPQARRRL